MRTHHHIVWAATSLAALFTVSSMLTAGPLGPPPGPVAPTPGPEARTAINFTNTPGSAGELFRITDPGSYYLEDNITGRAGRDGILVVASDVTIDLNGFRMNGVVDSRDAIRMQFGGTRGLVVKNGAISNWGGDGVDTFNALNADTGRFENLVVRGNGGDGLVAGDNYTVVGCAVTGNGRSGVTAGASSVIKDTTSAGNTLTGLRVGQGGGVERCVTRANGGIGISASAGATIDGCTAVDNTAEGIRAGSGSTVSGCVSTDNSSSGFFIGSTTTVTGCTARSNQGDGIFADAASTIIGCAADSNGSIGIRAGLGSTVSGCAARSNGSAGFIASAGSTISGCTADSNTGDGIVVGSESLVAGNVCHRNGLLAGDGAGILVTGGDTRVEGNNVTMNDRGIDVNAVGNLVIRNSAADNTTNYSIAASNKVGFIVSAPNSGIVNGATGGNGVGSTDPWANFSF